MSLEIDHPFPVEGTVTPKETGYSTSLPCESEWLENTGPYGNLLQRAVDRAAREYGNGTTVRVRWTHDGAAVAQDFEILGPTEDGEQGGN